mgnify:CR=1 FL=1
MRTRRIVRMMYATLLLSALAPLGAQNNWEGTAVVGRYGEFPPGGLYAASNTFPLNSMVDVVNPATGEAVRVIVAREVDDPGVFLLVSESAAREIGLDPGESVTVRATPVQMPGLTAVDPNQDLPFHPDPDVNPAASLGDPNRSIVTPDQLEEAAPAAPPVAAVEPEPAAGSEPAPDPDPAPAVAVEPEPEPEPQPDPALDEPDPIIGGDPEEDVVGVPPTIADDLAAAGPEADEPERAEPAEASLPFRSAAGTGVLVVELAIPSDPNAAAVAAGDEEMPAEPEADDPLAGRLAAINDELAAREGSGEALDIAPAELAGRMSPPDGSGDPDEELPLVDLSAAIQAEVTEMVPGAPNPVRVSVELPIVEDRSMPQLSEPAPAPPEGEEDLIALPLVPVEDEFEAPLRITAEVPAEPRIALPGPDEPEETAVANEDEPDESLRPSLIPEDAVVSLEPAEFRSPEAPSPETDTLEPVDPDEPTDEEAPAVAQPVPPEDTAAEDADPVDPADAAPAPDTAAAVASEPDPEPAGDAEAGDAEAGDDPEALAAAPAAEPTPALSTVDLPLVADLESDRAYVQVAAFSSEQSVRRTIDRLGASLPVAVVSQERDSGNLYRVYVGPLSEDEKGSALFRVRSSGFRDAFVR